MAVLELPPGLTDVQLDAIERILDEQDEIEACREDPARILRHVTCVDAKTGEHFQFQAENPADGWYWQRELLDQWIGADKSVVLKARQLGITWLACALALWFMLFKPGSRVLAVSINQDEAGKLVNRVWDMLQSLPEHLRVGTTVLKPARGHRPSDLIELQHPDGRISALMGLPSTPKAGHGETAALVLLDEFSRQEYARETWKAILPTMAGGGRVIVISTANGTSNPVSGEGNFYHHTWTHTDAYGIEKRFLPWSQHPDRDDAWYQREAMALPARDRAEQYPSTEDEAFILTGDCWFDQEHLAWYARNASPQPIYRAQIEPKGRDKARIARTPTGPLRVFREPEKEHRYAIAADVATGRGLDFSAAYAIDLTDMALVAEYLRKIDADVYARDLHYIGRWYETALIAVEQGGGFGEPVTIFLRDGKEGRPPYPKQYRHRQFSRGDVPEHKPYGFPINTKTRPLVLEGLQRAIREHAMPWLTVDLLHELKTFVNRSTSPSPRAQEGCNDDRVMAAAIAVELYRQYGQHEQRPRKTRKPRAWYPWTEGY